MRVSDFYAEFIWCTACGSYVHYLNGLSAAYCCRCGGVARRGRSHRVMDEDQLPAHGSDSQEAWKVRVEASRPQSPGDPRDREVKPRAVGPA